MSQNRLTTVILIAAFALANSVFSLAAKRPKEIKANIRFLAESTLVRTTWGWNSDTYLAEISGISTNESELVRIVDEYPNWSPPLDHDQLVSETGSAFKLYRDPECDRPFSQIPLRAAPGDKLAILPIPLNYQLQFDRSLPLVAPVHCYRILRR